MSPRISRRWSAPPAPARGDDRPDGQDDLGVERLGHADEEEREDGRAPLGELEPCTVGRREVACEREPESRAGARGHLALEDVGRKIVGHARALVAHLDDDGAARAGTRPHGRRPAAVLDRVLDEGRDDLREALKSGTPDRIRAAEMVLDFLNNELERGA